MLARLIPLAVLTCLWISPSPGHAQDRPLPALENLQTFVATADSADLPRLQALVDTLAGAGDLRLVSSQQDRYVAGRVHDTFQQFHQGVPVLGGSVSRQRNGAEPGSVIGTMYRDIDVDVTPSVSAADAVPLLRQATGAEPATGDLPELLILQTLTGRFALAWSVVMDDFHRYFLDAHGGTVVDRHSLIKYQEAVGAGHGIQGVQKKVSVSQAGGRFEAHDRLRPAEIVTLDMRYNLERLFTLLAPNVLWTADDVAASPDNVWPDAAVVDAHAYTGFTYDHLFREHGWRGADGEDGRIFSMVNLGDDEGPLQNAFYLFPPLGPEGTGVFGYGQWEGGLPLASADIVGHELMHGVIYHALLQRTGFPFLPSLWGIPGPSAFQLGDEMVTCEDELRLTAGPDAGRTFHVACEEGRILLVADHGGAVEEALGDVLGTAVEFDLHANAAGPLQADYLSGEDTGVVARSMSDPRSLRVAPEPPPADYEGPPYVNPPRPDAYQDVFRFVVGLWDDEPDRGFFLPFGSVDGETIVRLPSSDGGGVHFNSTILSHAFYLAVEGGRNGSTGLAVEGVGAANFAQVERAFFHAVTQLMPPQVNFFQAANFIRRSAFDLYGLNSATFLAIHQAFNAVGLTIDPPGA